MSILPVLGGTQLANIYARMKGTAGECMGPTSTLNFWAAALGNVYNWQNNRYFCSRYWRVAGNVNNQTLWACNTLTTKGWRIILGNDRSTNVFFGAALRNITANTYLGMNELMVGLDNTGATVFSQNGSVGAAFTAPGAYTAADGTSLQAFGVDAASVNFGATQCVFLQHYVLDANITPAQMGAITGSVNALDCWNVSLLVSNPNVAGYIGAPTALYDWQLWNGATTTFTGSGGGAFTFTRTGTGGGQHAFPAWDRQRFPHKSYFFNARAEYYENGADRHSLMAQVQLTTNAQDTTNGPGALALESYGNNLAVVANNVAGFNVAGSNIALGNNIMAEQDVFDIARAIPQPGIPGAGTKTVLWTGTLQSEQSGPPAVIKVNAEPQGIRLASAATLTLGDAFAATVADVRKVAGDSLIQEVLGLTDVTGVKGPPVDAALPKVRAAGAGRIVVGEGWGFGTWFERISTTALADQFVDILVARGPIGTSTNWNTVQLASNDAFLNTYLTQTAFAGNLDYFIAAWLARRPAGGKLQLLGPTSYIGLGGNTPNASGWVLADFTTTISARVTAAANANVSFFDMVSAVSAGNKPDNKHYNPAGATQWAAALPNPP